MKIFSIRAGVLVLLAVTIYYASIGSETLPFQILHHKKGVAGEGFGQSVAGVGDVDGDGVDDFMVGSPRANPNGVSEAGSAYLFSGKVDSLLYRIDGDSAGDWLGYAVSGAGDVDGDGTADFIIGSPLADSGGRNEAGKIGVYSGRTGVRLWKIFGGAAFDRFGSSAGGVGDLDGDGLEDFIIGAPRTDAGGHGNAGSAFVYSAAACSLLFRLDGVAGSDFLGSSVAGAGDVNGDGKPDFIVGAPFADPDSVPNANTGAAYVCSGLDGTLLFTVRGDSADEHFGFSVAGAGDVDGDGRADVIVGAPNPAGLSDVGRALVFSGRDRSLLIHFTGDSAGDLFGRSVAGAGDVNGDGRADIIVGAVSAKPGGVEYAGSVYLYSGTDSSLLYRANGLVSLDEMGYSVSGAGDMNGDGRPDFIVSALFADSGRGAVFVYGLVTTDAPDEGKNRPARFELSQNYPNPFNPTTTIRYFLPKREKVTLEIFNLLGKRVRVLADEEQMAGEHTAHWDGKDQSRNALSSGIYFYRLKGKDFSGTKKMFLLK